MRVLALWYNIFLGEYNWNWISDFDDIYRHKIYSLSIIKMFVQIFNQCEL